MFGRVVDCEARPKSSPSLGAQGIHDAALGVGAEVIHHEVNPGGVAVATSDALQRTRERWAFPILTRVREAPAGERLEDTEDVRSASSHVLVVSTGRMSRSNSSARPGRVVQNDGTFVEHNDRLISSERPGVQPQHVLHAPDERLVDSRNAPHFFPATASSRGSSVPTASFLARPARRSLGGPPLLRAAQSSIDFVRLGPDHKQARRWLPLEDCPAAACRPGAAPPRARLSAPARGIAKQVATSRARSRRLPLRLLEATAPCRAAAMPGSGATGARSSRLSSAFFATPRGPSS